MDALVDLPSGVMRVMPENVTPLWSQFSALFKPAMAMMSTHTLEDVRRSVMTMKAQLWAQMEGSTVCSAATTEFVDYPAGMYVRVWLAGCRSDRRFDDSAFYDVMDRWREANSCVGFEAIGRHGWLRKFPRAQVEGLILRWTP